MIQERMIIDSEGAILTTYVTENLEEIEQNRQRPAVVICPGGGYGFTSDREAEPIAIKMLSLGFQSFVLRYSVKPHVFPQALKEVAKSVQLIRQNSDKWFVDSKKIIVAGFSAGGHLAASLGVFWNKDYLIDSLQGDPKEWCPNGLLLAYPVISSGVYGHQDSFKSLLKEKYLEEKDRFSLENFVSESTPPTFLWHTIEDDLVPVENSLLFAQSLREQKVPFSLHIFPKGGHGLSLANEETAVDSGFGLEEVAMWPELFSKWMKNNF